METLTEAISRLTADGFKDNFYAREGSLRARLAGTLHDPEKMMIHEIVRFEGETDPDEEAVVFALQCLETGTKGTFAIAYGVGIDRLDAEIVQRLERRARGSEGAAGS